MTSNEKKKAKKLALSIYNSSAFLQLEVYTGNKGNVKMAIAQIEKQLNCLKSHYNL